MARQRGGLEALRTAHTASTLPASGSAPRGAHIAAATLAVPSGNAVVQQRTLLTKTGMKGVQGGDPAGLSKAMCLIW